MYARLLVDSRFRIDCKQGESILEACERYSVYIKVVCRKGECKACVVEGKLPESEEWTEVCFKLFQATVV
jgi:ferredoxin